MSSAIENSDIRGRETESPPTVLVEPAGATPVIESSKDNIQAIPRLLLDSGPNTPTTVGLVPVVSSRKIHDFVDEPPTVIIEASTVDKVPASCPDNFSTLPPLSSRYQSHPEPSRTLTIAAKNKLKMMASTYAEALQTRPLATKGLTAGIVNMLAQLTSRYLSAPAKPSDRNRAVEAREVIGSGAYGLFVHTPLCQQWYSVAMPILVRAVAGLIEKILQRLFKPSPDADKAAGAALEEGSKKNTSPYLATAIAVVLTSVLFDPIYFAAQIFANGLLTGKFKSPVEAMEETRKTWSAVFSSAQRLWPAVRCVVFFLLPNAYVIPANTAASFFWNTYFNFRQAQEKNSEAESLPPRTR